MEEVIALERQAVEQFEPGVRAFGHRHCDGPVELHNGRRLPPRELAVERGDLRPIRVLRPDCLRVEGRDRGLELVWPRPPQRERAVEQRCAALGQVAVPERAVLLLEQDEVSVRIRAGAARSRSGRRWSGGTR